MPLDQDLQDIFKLLKEFSSSVKPGNLSVPSQNKETTQVDFQYVSPISGEWINAGGFGGGNKGNHKGVDMSCKEGTPNQSICCRNCLISRHKLFKHYWRDNCIYSSRK